MISSLQPKVDLNKINWRDTLNVMRVTGDTFAFLVVKSGGITLKEFIEKAGIRYSFSEDHAGNSYYECKKAVELKQNVDVVVCDIENNCYYIGDGIRQLLSLPVRGGEFWRAGERQDVKSFSPLHVKGRDRFPIFISSTSPTRKVKAEDKILYRLIPLE